MPAPNRPFLFALGITLLITGTLAPIFVAIDAFGIALREAFEAIVAANPSPVQPPTTHLTVWDWIALAASPLLVFSGAAAAALSFTLPRRRLRLVSEPQGPEEVAITRKQ